jgi:hypothetical protein
MSRNSSASVMPFRALCVRSVLVGIVSCAASVATADVSEFMFTVSAESSLGKASWSIQFPTDLKDWDKYDWDLGTQIPLKDPTSGALIATLNKASVGLVADPAIGLGFNVTSGPAATSFTVTSALLSFPAISPAVGRASAQVGVTDSGADGATLKGEHTTGAAYRAQYNGFVPGGSDFANLIRSVTAGPGGVAGGSEEQPPGGGYMPIVGAVSNMSAQWKFNLSGDDTANGSSIYEIIPEPGTLTLLLVGLPLLRRRSV